jgi:pimeloyl-ACP methyl ester carboxylesterase
MHALGVDPARWVVLPQDLPDVESWRARLADLVQPGDIVCGFSLGAIAVAQCADLLDDAKTLVLIALNPHADAPEKREGRETLRAAAKAGTLAPLLRNAAPALLGQPTEMLIETVIAMGQAEAALIDAQTNLALSRPSALPALSAANVPVVLVTGADDTQAPPARMAQAAAICPIVATSAVPGLGHFCLLEDPAKVAQAILDGLDELGVSQ